MIITVNDIIEELNKVLNHHLLDKAKNKSVLVELDVGGNGIENTSCI